MQSYTICRSLSPPMSDWKKEHTARAGTVDTTATHRFRLPRSGWHKDKGRKKAIFPGSGRRIEMYRKGNSFCGGDVSLSVLAVVTRPFLASFLLVIFPIRWVPMVYHLKEGKAPFLNDIVITAMHRRTAISPRYP